jgi:hypothetical protein
MAEEASAIEFPALADQWQTPMADHPLDPVVPLTVRLRGPSAATGTPGSLNTVRCGWPAPFTAVQLPWFSDTTSD